MFGVIFRAGISAAKNYATIQTAVGIHEQRKAQKKEKRLQQQAAAEAAAEKAHHDRELRWRMGRSRRRSGYGVNKQGGYPTGLL